MDKKIRVILIQSKWNNISALEKELFTEGVLCSIEKCSFSQEVVSIIEEKNPDVLFINITDSIPESIELCRKISGKIPWLPIIILSSEKDENAALLALKEGADDYVFLHQLRRLASAVTRAISLKRLQFEVQNVKSKELRARNVLREKRIIKKLLVENTHDLICELSPEGIVTYINKPLGMGLGYSASEIIGKNPIEIVHPEDRFKVIMSLKKALNEKKSARISFRCKRKDAEWRDLEASGDWVFDSEGNPVKAILVCRDVTEKLQTERALEMSRQYATSIIKSSSDMIIASDVNRRIIEFNPAAEHTFGYKKEEVIGKSIDILYADPSTGEEIFRVVLNEGHCVRDVVNLRKNGEQFISRLSASLLKGPNNEVLGVMGVSRDVTKEKKMEEELNHSRERFRQIVESVNIIPWEADFQKKELTYIGVQVEKILGYPLSMWKTPRFWEEHIHPEDKVHVINFSRNAAEKYDNYESEYRMIAADGRVVWIHDIVNVQRVQGKPVKLRGFMIDITAKKEIEETLRRTNIVLNTLIDASPFGIIVFDLDAKVQVWNEAASKILGWEASEMIGNPIPSELAQEIPDDFFKGELPANIETLLVFKEKTLRKKDGSEVYANLWYVPMLDIAKSKLTGMILLVGDVTEHKKIVEQMEKLANFPKFNPYTVLELDSNGNVTYFNEAATQMSKMLNKQSPADLLSKDLIEIAKGCLASGKSLLRREVRINDRTISWSFFPIVQNGVVHCYGADITDRIKLESQLRQAQKMECIGQLAAGMAHDFNNILTVVQGHVGMLLMTPYRLQPDQINSLHQINLAAEQGAKLTQKLLTFSRRQVIQPKFLDLGELVANTVGMLKGLLGETINEIMDVEPNLPMIWADQGMIEQVIMNLAVNARDAMPKGGNLTISVKKTYITSDYVRSHPQAREGEFVCLSVKDTGCGMDENVMSHLFEPFFTTKDIGKGTGLGLATVYGIVRQHDGWIEVTSAVGRGSEFKVYLPGYSTATKSVPENKSVKGNLFGNETILVVEDEEQVRTLIRNMLFQYGYTVFDASDANSALKIWEKNKESIDLIITDIMLPGGLSGKEFAERVLSQSPMMKVIYITGYSPDVVGEDFKQLPNQFYLPKPFTMEKFIKFIRDCLDLEKIR